MRATRCISPVLLQVSPATAAPGNLRELENTIKRYWFLQTGSDYRRVASRQRNGAASPSAESSENDRSLNNLVKNLKGGAEAAAIAQSLEVSGWNRKWRQTIFNQLQGVVYKITIHLTPPPRKHEVSIEKAPGLTRTVAHKRARNRALRDRRLEP